MNKTKCILCAFFKNMWKDIVKSFKIEKPSDPDWWIAPVFAGAIVFMMITLVYLYATYTEIVKEIFYYGCYGLGILIGIFMVGLNLFMFGKWIKNLYIKSKKECDK